MNLSIRWNFYSPSANEDIHLFIYVFYDSNYNYSFQCKFEVFSKLFFFLAQSNIFRPKKSYEINVLMWLSFLMPLFVNRSILTVFPPYTNEMHTTKLRDAQENHE